MINPCLEIEWESGSEKYSIFGMQFEGHQSKPLLHDVPVLARAISFDHSIENSTLTAELSDHNGYFSQKEEEVLFGKKVIFSNEDHTFFTGWVSEPPKTSNRIFKIKTDIYTVLKGLLNKAITKDEFSVLPEFDGTYGNIIIGNSTEGWFTAKQVDTNTYLAAWNPLSLITKAKTKDGIDINLNDINLLVQNNNSYIEYTSADSFLYFAAKGPTEGALIENPVKMFSYIIQNHTNLETEDLSDTEALYENRNYPANHLFITDDITLGEFFAIYSESFGAKPIITKYGKADLKPIKWGEQTYKASIRPSQIKDFQKWKEYKYMRKAWNRCYAFEPSQQKYVYTPQDLVATQLWSNEIGKFRHKFLLQDASSLDVGLREKYLREAPLLFQGFRLPFSMIRENDIDNGDIVRFNHRESFYSDQYRLMQILRIKSEKNSSFFYIEGWDLSEIQKKTFWVFEEGNPDNPWVYEDSDPRNPLAWFRY